MPLPKLITLILMSAALNACSRAPEATGVSVHGVNYSGDEFSYTIEDPANKNNGAGGESLTPYSAGGIMCCYALPDTWRPGLQVKINSQHYVEVPGKDPEAIASTSLVDVPQYPPGKPEELWILRNADGTLGLVMSNMQPNHKDWPGKVKGWPVPSLEYKRTLFDREIRSEEGNVRLYQELLDELRDEPKKRTTEAWEFAKKYDRDEISPFSGPNDPKYYSYLQTSYSKALDRARTRERDFRERRP